MTCGATTDEGSTALMAASEQNAHGSTTVRLLLKHPANPNQAQQYGISTLMSTARKTGHDEIVMALLEHSAHPSTELVARAATVPVAASAKRDPSGPRARHRQQHRLEVDKTRKRDVQTEGAAGAPSRGNHAGNSTGQLAGEVSGCMHDHAAIRIPSTVATPATGAMFREGPVFLG